MTGRAATGAVDAGFSRTDIAVGRVPTAAAVGAFNRDGSADVAVANFGSTTVSILLDDGSGTLVPVGDVPVITSCEPTDESPEWCAQPLSVARS